MTSSMSSTKLLWWWIITKSYLTRWLLCTGEFKYSQERQWVYFVVLPMKNKLCLSFFRVYNGKESAEPLKALLACWISRAVEAASTSAEPSVELTIQAMRVNIELLRATCFSHSKSVQISTSTFNFFSQKIQNLSLTSSNLIQFNICCWSLDNSKGSHVSDQLKLHRGQICLTFEHFVLVHFSHTLGCHWWSCAAWSSSFSDLSLIEL